MLSCVVINFNTDSATEWYLYHARWEHRLVFFHFIRHAALKMYCICAVFQKVADVKVIKTGTNVIFLC